MEKKILLALDDSENSMKAVAAVADTFTPDHHITLFSVIPDTFSMYEMYSPELTPLYMSERSAFTTLETTMKERFEEAQQKAKQILIHAGFQEKNIISKIQPSKKGVARDIMEEVKNGINTVVMGRRGLSGIKEFFLGSVSNKVVSSVRNVSVFLVD